MLPIILTGKSGGVLIGDVVGLGEDPDGHCPGQNLPGDHYTETLILCPRNLVKMWEDYVAEYRLLAKVLSLTRAVHELPDPRRYRVVLIHESQNLRNRKGNAIGRFRNTFRKTRANAFCFRLRPITKPISIFPVNFVYLCRRTRTWGFVLKGCSGIWGKPSLSAATVPGSLHCRFRKERIRRRLAGADAALHGQADTEFHSRQLCRHRSGHKTKVPDFRRWDPILFPRTDPQNNKIQG